LRWSFQFDGFLAPKQKLELMMGKPVDLEIKEVEVFEQTLYERCESIIIAKIKDSMT